MVLGQVQGTPGPALRALAGANASWQLLVDVDPPPHPVGPGGGRACATPNCCTRSGRGMSWGAASWGMGGRGARGVPAAREMRRVLRGTEEQEGFEEHGVHRGHGALEGQEGQEGEGAHYRLGPLQGQWHTEGAPPEYEEYSELLDGLSPRLVEHYHSQLQDQRSAPRTTNVSSSSSSSSSLSTRSMITTRHSTSTNTHTHTNNHTVISFNTNTNTHTSTSPNSSTNNSTSPRPNTSPSTASPSSPPRVPVPLQVTAIENQIHDLQHQLHALHALLHSQPPAHGPPALYPQYATPRGAPSPGSRSGAGPAFGAASAPMRRTDTSGREKGGAAVYPGPRSPAGAVAAYRGYAEGGAPCLREQWQWNGRTPLQGGTGTGACLRCTGASPPGPGAPRTPPCPSPGVFNRSHTAGRRGGAGDVPVVYQGGSPAPAAAFQGHAQRGAPSPGPVPMHRAHTMREHWHGEEGAHTGAHPGWEGRPEDGGGRGVAGAGRSP